MLSHRLRLAAFRVSLMLAAAALAWPAPAAARAEPAREELLLQLQLCRSLSNRAFRLNCFDALARDLPRATGGVPAIASSEQPDAATVGAVPLPPVRPAERFEIAEVDLPEMAEVERKTAVAVAGPSGADWAIAPSPPVQVATASRREDYEIVDSRDLGPGGPDVAAIFLQGDLASAVAPNEPHMSEPTVDQAATTPAVAEGVLPAKPMPGVLAVTPLPQPESESVGEIASLFDFTASAQAATAPAEVPLPRNPPERANLEGLLDGNIAAEPLPQSEAPAVDGAVATNLAPEAAMVTASLGDAPVSPTIKRNWSVSGWTSPLSGVRDMTITRAADRIDDGPVALLSFTCSNDSGAVQVVWPRGMGLEEAKAALVLDGEAEEPATWSISADGRTMSIEGRDSALAAAKQVAAAESLSVRIVDDPAHQWDASFGTDGLASHLEEFKAACGG